MNDLDLLIIQRLTEDARTSFRQIAAEAARSTDTVINHYERLTAEGVIRGSTVVLDAAALGYEGAAVFNIDAATAEGANPATIMQTLIRMPNIILATRTVGEHDIQAIAVIHDIAHYAKLGSEIAAIPGVKGISSNLWPLGQEICPRYFII